MGAGKGIVTLKELARLVTLRISYQIPIVDINQLDHERVSFEEVDGLLSVSKAGLRNLSRINFKTACPSSLANRAPKQKWVP